MVVSTKQDIGRCNDNFQQLSCHVAGCRANGNSILEDSKVFFIANSAVFATMCANVTANQLIYQEHRELSCQEQRRQIQNNGVMRCATF